MSLGIVRNLRTANDIIPIKSTKHHEINIKFGRSWLQEHEVPIVMTDVMCFEDDKNISDCSASFISHDCDHSEDIWLQCKGNLLVLFIT